MTDTPDRLGLLDDLVGRAKKHGADGAAAVVYDDRSLSIGWRLGKLEEVERSESIDIGLRVYVGQKLASASTTDPDPAALDALAERLVAMAQVAPQDPHAGLADPDQIAASFPDLDAEDPVEPSAERLTEMARAAEEAALAVDGITNSEGGSAGWGRTSVSLMTTAGFAASAAGTGQSIGISVLAGQGTGMERDYDYTRAVFGADLDDPVTVGRNAAQRTLRRLNPRKVESQAAPVLFEPRMAASLLRHLSGAINGAAVARGTSFLKDRMGEKLFGDGIVVLDDPLRRRGPNSMPFDGEGILPEPLKVIDDGVLTTWFLDLHSARQLGLKTNGRASVGLGGVPSPRATNLMLQPGTATPQDLMADVKSGLLITSMFGANVNGTTGDYSCGVAGLWIENGEPAFPVSELTVAGNLIDMWGRLTPADDLIVRDGTDSPTVRVDGMTVAGI